jgi:arylsulfatase A
MCDDLGAEAFGCYGGTTYSTPSIDALADTGILWDDAHCLPLCTPTRVMLLTGRYPFRTGWNRLIRKESDECLDYSSETTFAHLLRDAGYATCVTGKWHLCRTDRFPDHIGNCGFDEHCIYEWFTDGRRLERYWSPDVVRNGVKLTTGPADYGPDLYCDHLLDFMERERDRPFLAYHAMNLPHSPFHEPPPLPGVTTKNQPPKKKGDDERLKRMVAYMDHLVGRVVRHLEDLGLREQTLLVFTSDNGTDRRFQTDWSGRRLRGGKGRLQETGSRVPLLASWPGTVPAGQVRNDLVDLSDMLPTFAELAGTTLPAAEIDGVSIASQLTDTAGPRRDWVFTMLKRKYLVREKDRHLDSRGRLYRRPEHYREVRVRRKSATAEDEAARTRLQAVLDDLNPKERLKEAIPKRRPF